MPRVTILKRALFPIVFLLFAVHAKGQPHSSKDFIGRWRFYLNKFPADITFINDSAAVYTLPDGLKISFINYQIEPKGDAFNFRFTSDLYSVNKRYSTQKFKFLNDSTFYIVKGSDIPPADDIQLRRNKWGFFRKVRVLPAAAQARLPVWQDIVGNWLSSNNEEHIIIKDASNARFIHKGGKTDELNYVLSVDKYPMTILFTDKGTLKQELVILRFLDNNNWLLTRHLKNKPLEREPGFTSVDRYRKLTE